MGTWDDCLLRTRTQYTNPQTDGQSKLAQVDSYTLMATHTSTNRVQCRATTLITINVSGEHTRIPASN